MLDKEEDRCAREMVVEALGLFGQEAKEAVPKLIEILADEDEYGWVRHKTLGALANIGPEPGVVEALTDVLTGETPGDQTEAAKALGKLGPGAKEAVPALIEALSVRDPGWRLNTEAAYALGDIGPDATAALPELRELSGWTPATFAVAKIDPDDESSLLYLLELSGKENHSSSRKVAARALGKLRDQPGVIRALIDILGDEEPSTRAAAALALGEIGPNPSEALTKLQAIVDNDPDRNVISTAREAIWKIQGVGVTNG